MNTSGCGWPYSLRRYCTCHCISGRRVVCRSTRRSGTSYACLSPIKELNAHRGKSRWECFCMQCLLGGKPHSQIVQVPFGVFPHRPSSIRGTMVAIPSRACPVRGDVFRGLDVQSLRRYQCPRLLDRQTRTSPFHPSQGHWRNRYLTFLQTTGLEDLQYDFNRALMATRSMDGAARNSAALYV